MPKQHLSESVILHKLMPDAHEGARVQNSVAANARRTGEVLTKPKKREQAMAEHVLRVANLFESDRKETRERAYEAAVSKLLIDPADIPEAYWKQLQQIARDNGEGNIEFDDDDKLDEIKNLRGAQRTGAESWANYLEQTGNQYPTWFKIYAWDGMSRMGKFNKSKGTFDERDKTTVAPYPQLNPAALAKVHTLLTKHLESEQETLGRIKQLKKKKQAAGHEIHRKGGAPNLAGQYLTEEEEAELRELKARPRVVTGKDFNELYSKMLLDQKAIIPTPENPEDVKGKWHTYTSNDIEKITQASEGTPWCIAGEDAAAMYTRDGGEFHLFHLTDSETGEESPTACASIRMSGGLVDEISGLKGDSKQYVEDALVPTVESMVKTLPGGERYLRAFADKQLLIAMDRKFVAGDDFTVEELEFLYELNRKIEYIDTYAHDPRPKQFREQYHSRNEEILRQKYSSIDVHVLMTEQPNSMKSIDQLAREGVSGPVLLGRIHQYSIPENLDTLVAAGNDIAAIVGRMNGAAIIENIERLESLGATIDIDAAIADTDDQTVAAHLPMLLARGSKLDVNEFERSLTSYTRMKFIGNLVDAGAKIDLDTLVERNGPQGAVNNLDEVARVGAAYDTDELVQQLHDPAEVLRNIDTLLRHGADPNKMVKRFTMSLPVAIAGNLQKLKDAGATIDIEDTVNRLESYEKAQYLKKLREFGATIDSDQLLHELGDSAIYHLDELVDADDTLDMNQIVKQTTNVPKLVQSMETLMKGGADIDIIMNRLGEIAKDDIRGISGRAIVNKLFAVGADREKIKQVFNLTDERIDGLEAEANAIVAETTRALAERRTGIGRYRR